MTQNILGLSHWIDQMTMISSEWTELQGSGVISTVPKGSTFQVGRPVSDKLEVVRPFGNNGSFFWICKVEVAWKVVGLWPDQPDCVLHTWVLAANLESFNHIQLGPPNYVGDHYRTTPVITVHPGPLWVTLLDFWPPAQEIALLHPAHRYFESQTPLYLKVFNPCTAWKCILWTPWLQLISGLSPSTQLVLTTSYLLKSNT